LKYLAIALVDPERPILNERNGLITTGTNPRKRFDEKNLEELAASMRAQGILAPLLVRELEESKYEVVAGARRLSRAAQVRSGWIAPITLKPRRSQQPEAPVLGEPPQPRAKA
jgi:ParB family transcriptional regulator, chromosome partitioning protein